METDLANNLKEQVRAYWDRQSCDTHVAAAGKFSREYFEEIEAYRYRDQPFIHSFAQFTRYHGKRVLEVGFGAGTDFIQWLRAGARASAIDLTQEGLDHVTRRIQIYGLPAPESIRVADAENLPYESETFDLGYSFGVLHHTPGTEAAMRDLVRVIRSGGELKIMLYNRHSICALNTWIKHALLQGRPWKNLRWAVANHVESIGTKAYTRTELRRMLAALPLDNIQVQTFVTSADDLAASAFPPLNWFYRLLIRCVGTRPGWQISDYKGPTRPSRQRKEIAFTGNRLGWFHCISARKKA
jgi:SAM-dependent methyltransferase